MNSRFRGARLPKVCRTVPLMRPTGTTVIDAQRELMFAGVRALAGQAFGETAKFSAAVS
jgi:hypothetical protein